MDPPNQTKTEEPRHKLYKLVVASQGRQLMVLRPAILVDGTWLHSQLKGIEVSSTRLFGVAHGDQSMEGVCRYMYYVVCIGRCGEEQ